MKKTNFIECSVLALLLVCMPAGPAVHAAEDTQKKERTEDYRPPAKKNTAKKKTAPSPDRFEPTDKVSADRAVAFPTDI